MFLGVLAAYGYKALVDGWPARFRAALAGALVLGLLAEYHVTVGLADYSNAAPPIYRMLAHQPRGVVAEFPVPPLDALPGADAEYSFMSIFHWFPLVNGYSGVYPPSYLDRVERLHDFPDEASILQLRRDNVAYVIVHGSAYPGSAFEDLRIRIMATQALAEVSALDDANGRAVLYRMR
jgi:hypothetical protein